MRVVDLTKQLLDFEGKPIPVDVSWIQTEEGQPVALILDLQNRAALAEALKVIKLKLAESEVATVKWALGQYLQQFSSMGLSKEQQDQIYQLGFRIFSGSVKLELDKGSTDTKEHDALKALCDSGARKVPNEPERDILRLPVMKHRLREIVINAPVIPTAEENAAPEPKEKKGK